MTIARVKKADYCLASTTLGNFDRHPSVQAKIGAPEENKHIPHKWTMFHAGVGFHD